MMASQLRTYGEPMVIKLMSTYAQTHHRYVPATLVTNDPMAHSLCIDSVMLGIIEGLTRISVTLGKYSDEAGSLNG